MFTEVIKLVPTVDRSALQTMFQNLNSRFGSVARKFGDGMKSALKLGGIAAIGSVLLAKLLNPLQKAEEIIDRILNKGDDAVTNAEEFNSAPGKVLRGEAFAKSKGLDPEIFRQLLSKFQGALAKEQEAATAPQRIEQKLSETNDPLQRQQLGVQLKAARETAAQGGILHEFLNEKDTVDAFFKFFQSLQKVDKPTQTVVQNQIFGERTHGKTAELLNTQPGEIAAFFAKLPSLETLNAAAKKTGGLSDKKDELAAIRDLSDFVTKSGLVQESMVVAIDKSQGLANEADNQTLRRFDASKNASIAIQELTAKFDDFATDFVNNTAPLLVSGVKALSKFAEDFLPSFKETKEIIQAGFDKGLELIAKVSNFFGSSPGEVLGQATSAVGNFVTPLLPTVSKETRDEIQSGVNSAADAIDAATTRLENLWLDFKSSRIYTTFGGGKK